MEASFNLLLVVWGWISGTWAGFVGAWQGSHWLQLIPDLIVALATGLLVGLIIWLAQLYRAGWEERNRASIGSSRLVHPLILELQMSVDNRRFESLVKLSKKRARALRIIESAPVEHWHKVRPTKLTEAILAFRNACWSTRVSGEELENALKSWCAKRHIPRSHLRYAVARIKGAPQFYVNGLYRTPARRGLASSTYNLMRNDKRIISHTANYRKKSTRLARFESELIDVLVAAIKRQRQGRSWSRAARSLQ